MREVRMTFGEHLEELRSRIIVALFYLAIGVTIAFVYGDTLMEAAMWPHRRAFGGAQRKLLIERMEEVMDGIEPLMTMNPSRATVQGEPIVEEGKFHWEAVLGPALLRERMLDEISGPWLEGAEEITTSVKSLSDEDRKTVSRVLVGIGESMAEVLVDQITTDFRLSGVATIPDRFYQLEDKVRRLREADVAGSVKSKIGWGKDLGPVLESLSKFNRFLEMREAEIQSEADTLDLARVREWAGDLSISEGLSNALEILENAYEKLSAPNTRRIQVIDYTEQFSAYLKIVVVFGIFFSVPFILYELWKFVGAGLYLNEQRYVVTFMPFSMILFFAGGVFGYFVMIPVGLEFLASWHAVDVELNFRLGNYVGIFLTLTLILGVVFQTPLVMVFLNRLGIVSVDLYRRARRVSVFIGVCLAVVLTPPDPFSWSLMAAPMILLYEVGILVCQMLSTRSEEKVA